METHPIAYNSTEIVDRDRWQKLPPRFCRTLYQRPNTKKAIKWPLSFVKTEFISGERENNRVREMKKFKNIATFLCL